MDHFIPLLFNDIQIGSLGQQGGEYTVIDVAFYSVEGYEAQRNENVL